jgi:hypothetical protein
MNDRTVATTLGGCAIIGGGLRIASSFIPWAPDTAWLEGLYFAIDTLLLFGLMGIYFAHRARLGVSGFAMFAVAETGIASIVGPDTTVFGIDTYQAGVAVISIGLALLGVVMLVRRAGTIAAPLCWIASTAAGAAGGVAGQAELGFLVGGLLFGLGFIVAGAAVIGRDAREPWLS